MRRVFAVTILAAILTLSFTGCGLDTVSGLLAKPADAAVQDAPENKEVPDVVSKDDDQRIKTLIDDYFAALYAEPVENYSNYSLTGKIPPDIKNFLSKMTISTADGNPEIGLHLPRYIEINGLVAIGYSVVKNAEETGEEKFAADARFVGNRSGSSYYYVKLPLIAKCIDRGSFEALYGMNAQTGQWKKKDALPINEGLVDYVRLQARYDVEAKKDDGTYKLVTVKEANTKDSLANRLVTYNNDFVTRLPYLDLSKTEDGKAYVNKNDGKTYEEEKSVIAAFFKSLCKSLDSESMKLLYSRWKNGTADFKGFLTLVGQSADDNSKKLPDYMDIKDNYKTKFDFDSFPLQPGMETLKDEFNPMEIEPHPGYTKNEKVYTLTFNAPATGKLGGSEGKESRYFFGYIVTLTRVNEVLKVSGIKMFEASEVQPAEEK